jgi:iron complex transport system substrate-binding protein
VSGELTSFALRGGFFMQRRFAPGAGGLVAVALVLSIVGCGSQSSRGAGSTTTAVGSDATAPSAFPVTLRGVAGATVIKHKPTRVVSLSATATEDLFAIGAGDQVVAVDDRSNYPPSAPRTKLSGFQPNIEAIAGYRPDLVVISGESPPTLAPALRGLGIPVLIDAAARTLAQAYAQIEQLGIATGHARQAKSVAAEMRSRIAALVRGAAAEGRGLSVYDEISPDFYSASSRTFVGQLLSRFGLRDAADRVPDPQGLGYPKLSAEYLVAADPEIVLLSDTVCCGQNAATVARRPGWSQLRAVRDHTIVALNDDIASRWGPRTVDLTAAIARAIAAAHAAGLRP